MNITSETANLVVKETMKHVKNTIHVFNANGIIISSGDKSSVHAFHQSALEAINLKRPVAVTTKEQHKWKGAEPGINFPIKMQDKVIGAVGIAGTPSKVEQFGSLIVGMAELIIKQNTLLKNTHWKYRTVECLLEELTHHKTDFFKIHQKLLMLGYKVTPPYYPLIFSVADKFHHDHLNFSGIYEKVEAVVHPHSCIYGFLDAETFIIIIFSQSIQKKHEIHDRLETFFAAHYDKIRSSSGNAVGALEEVPAVLHDALLALKLTKDQRVKIKDLEIQLLLNNIDKQKRLKAKKRIQQKLCEELKDTLSVFFQNDLNIQATAEALFIHRNTLLYRLKKIESITSYNPRNFHEALILQLSEWL